MQEHVLDLSNALLEWYLFPIKKHPSQVPCVGEKLDVSVPAYLPNASVHSIISDSGNSEQATFPYDWSLRYDASIYTMVFNTNALSQCNIIFLFITIAHKPVLRNKIVGKKH